MENNTTKNRVRMPLGAAIACILITALFIVGAIVGFNLLSREAERLADRLSLVETGAPIVTQIPGADADESDIPSDKLSYSTSGSPNDEKYKIIEECMSAVVSIDVTMQNGHQSVLAGSGSGVLVSYDGYVVTCNHVVSGAEKIYVYLNNGETYEATLVGLDSITDLAVIKIAGNGLPYAELGNSSTIMVGEGVFAVGNALGELSNTYTSGSISALDRNITVDGQIMTLLQTDAAINQGNSGGGLFRETDGSLIGIVNAKSSGSGIEGLGFAIPSNVVSNIISDLMDYGFVTGRPYLGVETEDIKMTGGFGFFSSYYTYPRVTAIAENSAAAVAGMEIGDVIISVNGTNVSGSDNLQQLICACNVGDSVTLSIMRGNNTMELTVTLTERTPE